jgi:hypothetical protein
MTRRCRSGWIRKASFCEQKEVFAPLGRAGFAATGPAQQKFLRRFFSKSGYFPF